MALLRLQQGLNLLLIKSLGHALLPLLVAPAGQGCRKYQQAGRKGRSQPRPLDPPNMSSARMEKHFSKQLGSWAAGRAGSDHHLLRGDGLGRALCLESTSGLFLIVHVLVLLLFVAISLLLLVL